MRFPVKLATVLGLLVTAIPAQASVAQYGYVYGFQAGSTVVYFQTTGPRTGTPSCSNTNFPQRWAFDASTPAGQTTLSIVLTAYALHRPLVVVGTGSCSVSSDAETVDGFATDNV